MWVFARGDGDQLGLSPWLSESARGSVYSKQIILRAYFLPGTVLKGTRSPVLHLEKRKPGRLWNWSQRVTMVTQTW